MEVLQDTSRNPGSVNLSVPHILTSANSLFSDLPLKSILEAYSSKRTDIVFEAVRGMKFVHDVQSLLSQQMDEFVTRGNLKASAASEAANDIYQLIGKRLYYSESAPSDSEKLFIARCNGAFIDQIDIGANMNMHNYKALSDALQSILQMSDDGKHELRYDVNQLWLKLSSNVNGYFKLLDHITKTIQGVQNKLEKATKAIRKLSEPSKTSAFE